jgi:hypothetical protein
MEGRRVDTPTTQKLREAKRARRVLAYVDVPVVWMARVHRIHRHALPVLLHLKRMADMQRAEPFTLPAEIYTELGMDRWARDRCLAALEAHGVIRVERHRGRQPRIWLLEKGGLA